MPKCSHRTSQTTHKTKHTSSWLVIKWTFSDIISFCLNLHRRSSCVYMTSNLVSHLERSFNYHRPPKTQSHHGTWHSMPYKPQNHTCFLKLTITTSLHRFGSAVFAQTTVECPYTFQWDAHSPPKICPFPWGDLDPHLIHGTPGPPKSSTQTAARSVQPFLQGSLVWQTDRQTTLLSQ